MGVLDNRHALITGGGTGIGAAIARALAGEGAAVSLAGRRQAPLENVAASLAQSDGDCALTRDEGIRLRSHGACGCEAHGPIDIVVANAGTAAKVLPSKKMELSHWQSMIDVNLTGAFLTVKAALRRCHPQIRGNAPDCLYRVDGRVEGISRTSRHIVPPSTASSA